MFYAVLVGHVLLTTAGYGGLIATTAYMLFVAGVHEPQTVRAALAGWQRSARIFGPLLGLGLLLGFSLAGMLHVPLGSAWLLVTYVLVAVAMGVQAGVMVPWQIRSGRNLAGEALPSLKGPRFVLVTLSVIYTAIVGLMIVRPG